MRGKLAIMGSGETAPTMVKVHRELLSALHGVVARTQGSAVLLDTPFGFQENADEITAKALEYFRVSLTTDFEVASLRNQQTATATEKERFLRDISKAKYIFAGPGSPTYALNNWAGVKIADHLVDRVNSGATLTFSSAAALTLGEHTLPVYEIYKVGEDPHWLEGLGVFSSLLGVEAAVIPHYNNKEGTNHDTRFCYMGQRRLNLLESYLASNTYTFGIDEHTGAIFDLESMSVKIVGIGTVTLRRAGNQKVLETGTQLDIDEFFTIGDANRSNQGTSNQGDDHQAFNAESSASEPATITDPLSQRIDELKRRFDAGLSGLDASEMTESTLDLEAELYAWGSDTLQSDQLDRGRAVLRQMIHTLGETSELGLVPKEKIIDPFIQLLIRVRGLARSEKNFGISDAIRDELSTLKVELRDTPSGTQWTILA